MTFCRSFLKTKKIPTCTEVLTVATISNESAELQAQFENLTTGRFTIAPASSDGDGLVTVDLTGVAFPVNNAIMLSLSLVNQDPENKITMTIEGETSTELMVRFKQMFDENGNCFSQNTTLVLE